MIAAGKLDQRLDVLVTGTPSRDSFGQTTAPFIILRKIWARAMEGMGKEFVASGQINDQARVAFQVRWASDLAEHGAKLRIGWKGRLFEVTATTGTRRRGELWLHCQSIGVYEP